MDRRGMESFGAWSPLAYLSPDENRKKAIGFRAFALGKGHDRHRRNHESGEEGERNVRFPLWRRKRRSEELDEEIQAHLTLAEREQVESGQTRRHAELAARHEFGNVGLAAEVTRDMWGWRWLADTLQDVRYGSRMLRKSPGFTAIAVLTLALGIGANTAIFSLIDALFLRSLPVQKSQELVMLKWSAHKPPDFYGYMTAGDCRSNFRGDNDNPTGCSFTHSFFNHLKAQASMFASVTASGGGISLDMSGNGPASIIEGLLVAGNYFDALGVHPAFGRLIKPSDEDPSAQPVMVLNNGYWQRVFGGSPSIVGKTIDLNGVPTTIVGVAEPRFLGLTPGSAPDA